MTETTPKQRKRTYVWLDESERIRLKKYAEDNHHLYDGISPLVRHIVYEWLQKNCPS